METKNKVTVRATNREDLGEIAAQLFTETSYKQGLLFQPRPDDIIISPAPKSGTT